MIHAKKHLNERRGKDESVKNRSILENKGKKTRTRRKEGHSVSPVPKDPLQVGNKIRTEERVGRKKSWGKGRPMKNGGMKDVDLKKKRYEEARQSAEES